VAYTLASSRAPQANLVRALGTLDRSAMRLSVDFRPPVQRRGFIAVADDAPFVVCVSAPAFGSGRESVGNRVVTGHNSSRRMRSLTSSLHTIKVKYCHGICTATCDNATTCRCSFPLTFPAHNVIRRILQGGSPMCRWNFAFALSFVMMASEASAGFESWQVSSNCGGAAFVSNWDLNIEDYGDYRR
jgi:hypothetical protein